MSLNMRAKARNEYLQLKKKRYQLLSGKKAKGKILSEVQETVGYSRKHLIRKFSSLRKIHTNSQPGSNSVQNKKVVGNKKVQSERE